MYYFVKVYDDNGNVVCKEVDTFDDAMAFLEHIEYQRYHSIFEQIINPDECYVTISKYNEEIEVDFSLDDAIYEVQKCLSDGKDFWGEKII